MNEKSVIDEALKLGAIIALSLWTFRKGYEYGLKRRKEKEDESSKWKRDEEKRMQGMCKF